MFRIALLFFSASLVANPLDHLSPSLPEEIASIQQNLSEEDFVYPLSGQLALTECDLIVKGAQNVALTRTFVSPRIMGKYSDKNSHDHFEAARAISLSEKGWQILDHLWCGYNPKSTYFQIKDPSGFVLEFKIENGRGHLVTPPFGMSNLIREEPDARADLRNTELYVEGNSLRLVASNGTQRIYEKIYIGAYRLEKELLPNGKIIRYLYRDRECVKIISTDPEEKHVYASIEKRAPTRYVGSDGREVEYMYETRQLKGKKDKTSIRINCPLLTKSVNPVYPNAIGYNERFQIVSYDARRYPVSCSYTNHASTPARIASLTSPSGSVHFSYDSPIAGEKGGSTTIHHLSGAQTVYRFNKQLLLTAIERSDGTEGTAKLFFYDEKQHICRIETKDLSGHLLLTRHFICDESGNPLLETREGDFGTFSIRKTFSKNRILSEERDDGLSYNYTYLGDTCLPASKATLCHGLIVQKILYRYDNACNLIEETEENRTTTIYTLSQSPSSLHRVESKETRDCTGHLIQKIRYSYDAWGNISQEEVFGSDGNLAFALVKTHDARSLVLSETNPLGQTARYEYDERGRVICEIPFSQEPVLQKTYDTKGREIARREADRQTRYAYDSSDRLIQKIDHLGWTTNYTYVPLHNQPIEIEDSILRTRFVYDAFGRAIEEIDAYGRSTSTRYNSYGLPLEVRTPSGSLETFEYAPNGNLLRHIDPDGIATSYTYDPLRRILSRSIADATHTYRYDAYHLLEEIDEEGILTSFTYDASGKKLSETRAGRSTTFSYNPLGFLASVETSSRLTEYKRDLLGRILEQSTCGLLPIIYTYDAAGRISSIAKGSPTTFYYDLYGRLIQTVDPLGQATSISYLEQAHNVIKTTLDPRGIRTVETYDPHGLLLKKEVNGLQVETFSYDRTLKKIRQNHLTFSYTPEGYLEECIEANQRTTRYAYTPAGRLLQKILPDGQVISYEYDPRGNPIKIGNRTLIYDKQGRVIGGTGFSRKLDPFGNILKEEFSNQLSIESSYDEFDRPTKRHLPDGSSIEYNYDSLFLKTVSRFDPTHRLLYTHTYDSYDAQGNLLGETHLAPVHHSYDLLHRPIQKIDPYLSEDYRYDASGNLIQQGSISYTYDALSQLVSQSDQFTAHYNEQYDRLEKNNSPASYDPLHQLDSESYSLNGSLLRPTFAYDIHHQLIEANNQSISYDALGRRLQKGTLAFLYLDHEEIASFENGVCRELQVPGLSNAIGIEIDSKPFVPIHDIQGTIRLLIDRTTNQIVQTNSCDAFGCNLNPNIPYSYSKKRFDPDTGLIYFGKRYYDPTLARWLTPDPLGPIDHANLYQYVFNNPLRYHDLHGEFAVAIPLVVWGAELVLPTLSACIAPIVYGALTGAISYAGYQIVKNCERGNVSLPVKPPQVNAENNSNQPKPSRNRFQPDPKAIGDHTVFKRDSTGKVVKYETYRPQTNVRDPRPWESTKRYDGVNPDESHYNKILRREIYEPHVHDPNHPGGVRPADFWEIPK